MEASESSSDRLTRLLDESDLRIDQEITAATQANGTRLVLNQVIGDGTVVGFTKQNNSITAVVYSEGKPFLLIEDCNY